MCGINGILTYDEKPLSESINQMNNLIIHRGPDDDGIFVETNEDFSIALGMRRLSVIDLSNGNQPMYSEDKMVIIVFNGEIYNYQKLKKELELENVTFRTNSDTEVILKMYLKYGVNSFSRLDGMFAFSIYDKNLNKLFIARDFFGEKPLYYKKTEDEFIWASELKSIVSSINKPVISKQGLELFFVLNYIPAPYTIYDGISKLEPNSYLEIDLSSKLLICKTIQKEEKTSKILINNFDEAKKITRNLIEESVESRSVSDVSIGSFLSGGVDSSIISLCMAKNSNQKIDTFSIGFENKMFDETEKSKLVAKLINSNHHEFIIAENTLSEDIDSILLNFDEPFGDASALATYLISKQTRSFVKVALTGDGGDEVFGGYNKHYMNVINERYISIVPLSFHKFFKKQSSILLNTKSDNRGLRFKLKKVIESVDYNNQFYWNIISLGFKPYELKKVLINEPKQDVFSHFKDRLQGVNENSLHGIRSIDKIVSLEGDMLPKVDRTSMMVSLECRAPFLNKKIWDFTNSLPENFLIHRGKKKYILKESFKDFFPEKFLYKSKKGFGVPVGDWLRSELKDEFELYVNEKFVKEQGLFDYTYIKSLVMNHINGKEDSTFKVWPYYCFQKWYRNVFMNLN